MSSYHREGPYGGRQRSPSPGRNGRRGGPVRSGYRGGSRPEQNVPIDRSRVCPILIKTFVFDKGTQPSETSKFEESQKSANEVHLYTWMDSSLSDLKVLIKKVWSSIDDQSTVTFYRGCTDSSGNNSVRQLGVVQAASATSASSPAVLQQSGFEKGDHLYITIS